MSADKSFCPMEASRMLEPSQIFLIYNQNAQCLSYVVPFFYSLVYWSFLSQSPLPYSISESLVLERQEFALILTKIQASFKPVQTNQTARGNKTCQDLTTLVLMCPNLYSKELA